MNPEVQIITPPVIKDRPHRFFGFRGGEIYTVFDEESESEVGNLEILHPDLEIKQNPPKNENPYFPLFLPFVLFFGGGVQ